METRHFPQKVEFLGLKMPPFPLFSGDTDVQNLETNINA